MSNPGKYGDISKQASDLLTKDFPAGSLKAEFKTSAKDKASFVVSGNRDKTTGFFNGELKFKFPPTIKGVDVTETITTNNSVSAEVELKDFVPNTKFSILQSLIPSGLGKTKVGAEYRHDYATLAGYFEGTKAKSVNGELVVGYDKFLLGGDVSYDINNSALSKTNVGVAYKASDYVLSLQTYDKFSVFSTAYFHRVSATLEAGGKVSYKHGKESTVVMEAAAKYIPNKDFKDNFFKLKVDNTGKIYTGITNVLATGVKLNIGVNIDSASLNDNRHSIGANLTFEA